MNAISGIVRARSTSEPQMSKNIAKCSFPQENECKSLEPFNKLLKLTLCQAMDEMLLTYQDLNSDICFETVYLGSLAAKIDLVAS